MGMKRFLILVLSLSLVASHSVSAQISGGAGYLKTRVTAEKENGSGEGLYAGLSYRIHLAGAFSLLPGVYFTRTEESGGEYLIDDMILPYGFFIEKALVAPLHVHWGIDLPYDIRAFVFAGPSFQYGLSCESPSGLTNVPASDLYDKDGLTHRRWNILAGVGAGLSFPTKSTQRVFLTAGCDYGLVNLYEDKYLKSNRSLWKAGIGLEF